MENSVKRDSMVFYESFLEAVEDLPAEEFKKCVSSILMYGLRGEMPETHGIEKTIFVLVKPQIDKNNQRWENAKKKGSAKPENFEKSDKADKSEKHTHAKESEDIVKVIEEIRRESKAELVTKETNTKPKPELKSQQKNEPKSDNYVQPHADFIEDDFEYEEEITSSLDFDDNNGDCQNIKEIKEPFGEYFNVLLSLSEKKILIDTLGLDEFLESCEYLSRYMKRKPGYKSASHFEDLRGWVRDAVSRQKKPKPETKPAPPGFDIEFEDIFEKL